MGQRRGTELKLRGKTGQQGRALPDEEFRQTDGRTQARRRVEGEGRAGLKARVKTGAGGSPLSVVHGPAIHDGWARGPSKGPPTTPLSGDPANGWESLPHLRHSNWLFKLIGFQTSPESALDRSVSRLDVMVPSARYDRCAASSLLAGAGRRRCAPDTGRRCAPAQVDAHRRTATAHAAAAAAAVAVCRPVAATAGKERGDDGSSNWRVGGGGFGGGTSGSQRPAQQ